MACTYCGEYRFSGLAQGNCHALMNHAAFSCGCDRKFLTEKELANHKETMASQKKSNPCTDCCRSFDSSSALTQHRRDKGHTPPNQPNRCPCGKLCKSPAGLVQHVKAKQDRLGIEKGKYKSKGEYLDKYYKDKVMVNKDDRKQSVEEYRGVLNSIMAHVRKQEGGDIYGAEIRTAGSHATGTKVMKADEFDTNIPLKIPVGDVRTRGTVGYIYKDKQEPRNPKVK